MLAIHSISLGCPKNRVDTERLLGALGPLPGAAPGAPGFRVVDDPAEADLVLVNTCGFIQPAVEESVSVILDLAERIGEAGELPSGRRAVLAVAGCLVSRYGGDELGQELPEVDLWLATHELHLWPERIGEALGLDTAAVPEILAPRSLSTGPSYAYLKVGEGCGHNCAFCTIPSIRGPLCSMPLDQLKDEARALLDQGVREIVLVAQDLTSYGADHDRKHGLIDLVEALSPLPGLARLRPMYLYPAGLTSEVLRFLGDASASGPLVPYFDVPLQHAHPDVLRAMGRPFARDPRRVIDQIREHVPHAALRTSIITGFPGETETAFAALRDFILEARFLHLGVFAYQAEDGTPAAAMADQVDEDVREARRDELMALQAEISAELLEPYLGQEVEVLVDAPHEEWPGLFTGRVWFQAPEVDGVTFVSGPGVEPGALVKATVEQTDTYDLSTLV